MTSPDLEPLQSPSSSTTDPLLSFTSPSSGPENYPRHLSGLNIKRTVNRNIRRLQPQNRASVNTNPGGVHILIHSCHGSQWSIRPSESDSGMSSTSAPGGKDDVPRYSTLPIRLGHSKKMLSLVSR
jgi:hypothetical protein